MSRSRSDEELRPKGVVPEDGVGVCASRVACVSLEIQALADRSVKTRAGC